MYLVILLQVINKLFILLHKRVYNSKEHLSDTTFARQSQSCFYDVIIIYFDLNSCTTLVVKTAHTAIDIIPF